MFGRTQGREKVCELLLSGFEHHKTVIVGKLNPEVGLQIVYNVKVAMSCRPAALGQCWQVN